MSSNNTAEKVFTHKGWFVLCPIKIAEPFSGNPCVAARWEILEPWFSLNEVIQASMMWILYMLDRDYEPMWMFRVTGELK